MVSGNKPGESNALQVQIPCIVFFVLTPIFVGIRVWSRIKLRAGLGYDDWTILVSFLFSMAVMVLMMVSCGYGFGQHVYNLSPSNKKMTLRTFWVAQAFYKLTINLTKASILLLYLRIFVQRSFRIISYIMLGIVLSYMVATFFAAIFQCTPIPRAWDKTIPGTCIDITMNWYANAGFSIATDVIILVLPMPILYKSQLPPNQKKALMFVFALGGFVVVTSIFRMQTLNLSTTSPDTTYDIASTLWTMIEENVAIICACLPMCRLPLSYLFPSIFPSKANNNSYAVSSHPRSQNGTYGHAGTGKNEWMPSRSSGKDERAINLTSVKSKGLGDDTSEEFIFPQNHKEEREDDSKKIHKSVKYAVTFDDDDARESIIGVGGKAQQAASRV